MGIRGDVTKGELEKEARDALDEAIAKVTWAEYVRLKQRDSGNIAGRLNRAFRSVDRLQKPDVCGRDKPAYDQWDSPFYMSWYQPRQVHLIYAVLLQSAPRSPLVPLQVIDIGIGAWASMIALAIFRAVCEPALGTDITVYGIDPSEDMTQLGEELWLEFGCAAERKGIGPLIDTIDSMSGAITIFRSPDAYRSDTVADETSKTPVAESWLLSIHALYNDSKDRIRSFLRDCRERDPSRLRYQLITSDGNKRGMVKELSVQQGEWLGPPPEYWQYLDLPHVRPVWNGELHQTRECRRAMLNDLSLDAKYGDYLDPKYRDYLNRKVRWNPSNRIEKDAVWVWKATR